MSIFVVSGNNLPETTHVLMGQFQSNNETIDVNVNINDVVDPIKLKIYNDFFDLVGLNVSVEIINTNHVGSFNHVTPNNVQLEAIQIDYSLLNSNDQKIIDDAISILNTIE
jgi:hypothetical protein